MAPTAVDCSWQLAWRRLGEGVRVCVLFLFLLISKQFQQVNCMQAAWRREVLAQGRDCGWCSPPQNSVFS